MESRAATLKRQVLTDLHTTVRLQSYLWSYPFEGLPRLLCWAPECFPQQL
uniref:Uncharacterized protein n=1 Tax=Anguilla anguilla TaxID=7936 RepID=A0A0E9SNH6_ANGAN